MQGFPKTTDADRATIGITVRDVSATHTPIPTTRPQTLVRVVGAAHAHAALARSTEK